MTDERERIEQSNDIAGIVGAAYDDYVPLNVAYGIAHAMWNAGYRKVERP